MDEAKFNITASGDKLLLGPNFIELTDETFERYSTDSIDDFIEYIHRRDEIDTVYFNVSSMQQSNQMTAMTAEGFGDEIEFNTKPLASLSVAYSRQLDYLSGNNFKSLSVEDLIQLLKVMKKYSSDQTLKLQDQLSDLSIKKVISIDRSKDNKGNFAYAVKSENAGKQDYIFPETLNFTVPIFANNEKLVIDLEFEFIFKYAINDGGVKLQFSISNLTIWDDVILKAKEMVKEKFQSLQKAEIVVHYGRNKIEQHTDKDMYLITPLY